MSQPALFAPLTLRSVTFRNRVCVSPMCMYVAEDGMLTDFHLVHLGRFALGGAGGVFVEATAIEERGRLTYGDSGIWGDQHIAPLARIASFLKSQGAVAGIQLGHAGRKGSTTRPWFGMRPLPDPTAPGNEQPWQLVSSVTTPVDEKAQPSHALTIAEMKAIKQSWIDATHRAIKAGFDIVEVHSAHGYLLQQFLSPLVNTRTDEYGGDLKARMRYPLEVIEAVRAVWPQDKPLSVRISAVDGAEGGWSLDDSVVYARELKALGVDLVDCSSGGVAGSVMARVPRGLGFQVPFSERIKKEAGVTTMAVGLIVDPQQAEDIIGKGQADLVALARESLFNPQWALHARHQLEPVDKIYDQIPIGHGWWLKLREPMLRKIRSGES